jgi:hypothetical protein
MCIWVRIKPVDLKSSKAHEIGSSPKPLLTLLSYVQIPAPPPKQDQPECLHKANKGNKEELFSGDFDEGQGFLFPFAVFEQTLFFHWLAPGRSSRTIPSVSFNS